MKGGSNKEWLMRDRVVAERHRLLSVALQKWPGPRSIELIEAEEEMNVQADSVLENMSDTHWD